MRHAQVVQKILIEAGYSFKKVDTHEWAMYDGDNKIATNRSLGDLLRKQGNELGVW